MEMNKILIEDFKYTNWNEILKRKINIKFLKNLILIILFIFCFQVELLVFLNALYMELEDH